MRTRERQMWDLLGFFGDVLLPWQLSPELQEQLVSHLVHGSVGFMNATVSWPKKTGAMTMYHITRTFEWLTARSTIFKMVRTSDDLLVDRGEVKVLSNLQDLSWIAPAERAMKEELQTLFDIGVRSAQIAYQENNRFGGGFLGDSGLTKEGERLIDAMEKQGIVVDLSHLNDRTALGALKVCQKTPFISHTPCEGAYGNSRGAGDTVLRGVAKRGGVVGVMTMTFFNDPTDDGLVPFVRHLRHAIYMAGVEHVCIGSDGPPVGFVDWAAAKKFFMETQRFMDPDGRLQSRWPSHPSELFERPVTSDKFYECVLEAVDGKEDAVDKIMFGNARRFLLETLPTK